MFVASTTYILVLERDITAGREILVEDFTKNVLAHLVLNGEVAVVAIIFVQ